MYEWIVIHIIEKVLTFIIFSSFLLLQQNSWSNQFLKKELFILTSNFVSFRAQLGVTIDFYAVVSSFNLAGITDVWNKCLIVPGEAWKLLVAHSLHKQMLPHVGYITA